MTFAEFKTLFLDKYFPTPLRLAMEQEFLNLKQGTMTVTQYAAKFEELSRYALTSIPTEDKKAKRIEWGLTTARKAVVAQAFTTYAAVVKCALWLESEETDFKTRWRKATSDTGGPIRTQPPNNNRGPYHHKPSNSTQSNQPWETPGLANRRGETEKQEPNPSVIQGTLLLYSTRVQSLFDSSVSHSFISTACVTALALEIEPLSMCTKVSSPLGGRIAVSLVCRGCELEIANLRLTCDPGVINMADFNVIPGMD
ncbi:uncharacterized protein LOC131327714 [Rhododendron vialii]|uniref:uncharacterized protein LOC131327714 n=1 Tax=Rhododendron vialii TaxID=182163 RepID=UPI00265DFC2F|nr:uncharacterized protein LOC131327714 [Rhododendron vialii]